MTSEVEVDAVVLVGGQGTRLRPLTLSAPKPMLPTAGTPYLSHLFSRIRAAGIRHVVLGTSYRAEVFEEYFGDGSAHGLELEYVVEEEPLDTGGAIRNVYDRLRADHAIVFNGDILSGADLHAQLRTHLDSGADVTLHLQRVPDPSRFGSVPTDGDGRVTAFLEKTPNPPTDQINMRLLRLPPSGDRDHPGRAAGVGRTRDVPRAPRKWRASAWICRFFVLARRRYPGSVRPRQCRSGPRRRAHLRAGRADR